MTVGKLKKLLSKYNDDSEVAATLWTPTHRPRPYWPGRASRIMRVSHAFDQDNPRKVTVYLEPKEIVVSDMLKPKGNRWFAVNIKDEDTRKITTLKTSSKAQHTATRTRKHT